MHCRWGCNQLETRWRIIRDGMRRRSNYLVFIFGRWGRPPDSADIWSPAHLIGHKPSSSRELTEPEPYGAKHEGSAGGAQGRGLETGAKEVKLIVHSLWWDGAGAWQRPRNLNAARGFCVSSAVRVMEGNGTSANGAVIIGLQIVEGEVLHYTNSSQLSNI